MKTTLIAVSLTLLTGACVSTSRYEQAEERIVSMAEKNKRLEARLKAVETSAASRPDMRADFGIPPATHPKRKGPPQNYAWTTSHPRGCEGSPYSLTVHNDNPYYLKVALDEEYAKIRAGRAVMQLIPPYKEAHFCLSYLGEHTISGYAYTQRYGELVKVKFSDDPNEYFTHQAQFYGNEPRGQHYYISMATLMFHD